VRRCGGNRTGLETKVGYQKHLLLRNVAVAVEVHQDLKVSPLFSRTTAGKDGVDEDLQLLGAQPAIRIRVRAFKHLLHVLFFLLDRIATAQHTTPHHIRSDRHAHHLAAHP
jgi:hypothetical protein